MESKPFGWVAALAIAGAVACATPQTRDQLAEASAASAPQTARVTIRNDNLLDVAVYLVRGGARFRIGTVRGMSSETFRLADRGLSTTTPLRIMADPIGGNRRYMTDAVMLSPGQRLEVTAAKAISISSFAVWNR